MRLGAGFQPPKIYRAPWAAWFLVVVLFFVGCALIVLTPVYEGIGWKIGAGAVFIAAVVWWLMLFPPVRK